MMPSEPSRTIDLARPPDLTNLAVEGHGTITRLWQGARGSAGVGIEVSEVELAAPATERRLRDAWSARRAGSARALLLLATTPDGLLICGPDGSPPPVALLDPSVAGQILRRVLELPPIQASLTAMTLIARAQGSGSVPGFRNRSLVSTHFVTTVIRREQRPEWTEGAGAGRRARGQVGESLLRALGYELTSVGPREFQLEDAGQPVALVHLYDEGTNLDRVQRGQSAPPSSHALQRAADLRLQHAVLVAGPLLRIYSLEAEEALDEGAASAAYVEFDTTLLPDEHAPLLGALAAPDALRPDGRLSRIRRESGRYAVRLRERFTERLYEDVVDRLVRGLWEAARTRGLSPLPDEDRLYRATIVLLFRLLFLLYAEDRNLLPMRNAAYRRRSISEMVIAAAQTARDPGRTFDPMATSIWTDLRQLFEAVRAGNRDWGVPPYNGGLFEDDGLDGGLLARVELPNAVIGEALYRLGWDTDEAGSGKIDFGDLGVRQIGTVYEGLLSYEVAFAAEDLRVDRRAEGQPYVPVAAGEEAEIPAGTPHIRSPMGGRKATGSYYTPAFAVQRLIDAAARPALEDHLARLPDNPDGPTFFDIRVCDPAMGSGHFLVAALDALTDRFATSLARQPVEAVSDELTQARERLGEVGSQYGAPDLLEQVADIDLLRRLVLKRCIYGVDLNPMAVELARLGLWLHSFVPGLPLSYLGHTLRHGNSLVGVGAHSPDVGLFGHQAEARAREAAAAVASVTDLELGDIDESRRREAEVQDATTGLATLYDLITAEPLLERDFGWATLQAEGIVSGALPSRYIADADEARRASADSDAFHWRLAFPEVFLRDRPGFDAIVGNPPWEKPKVERHSFYVGHLPGLHAVASGAEREKRIQAFEAENPAIEERYQRAVAETSLTRQYLAAAYRLTRSGDPDLYKAFAERFLDLVRRGGRIGVVLPRSAFQGDGTAPFRDALFGATAQATIDVLVNSGGWVFADAEQRYTLVLLSATLGDEGAAISVSRVLARRTDFDAVDSERVEWSLDELRTAIPDLAIPLLPSHRMAALFRSLVTSHPRFDSARGGWHALPWREFDSSTDRKSGLIGDYEGPSVWPLYSGKAFDIWRPDHWRHQDVRLPGVQSGDGLAELHRKRRRSSVWQAFPRSVLATQASLPQHEARILFRRITRATDSRTSRPCLVPPRVFADDTAPSIVWPRGDARDIAYLLGVMASLPFDWVARRRVELHLNFFILNTLPVPRLPRADARWSRVVALSGRLAAVDERYRTFAEAVGVNFGGVAEAERSSMVSELDAVVAHAYGLDRDQLEAIFDDFPSTEAGVSPGRRAAILEWYDRWAS